MKFTTFAAVGALVLMSTSAIAESHGGAEDQASIIEAALAGGDVEAGEKVFKKCKACHMIGDGAKNRTGPILTSIVGAPIGASEDFNYSKGMVEHAEAGEVWTIENLNALFLKPRDFVTKTKMSFAGLKDEDDRANLIAYLASFATTSE